MPSSFHVHRSMTACSSIISMLMHLEWHHFHVTCSKGMSIIWGYYGSVLHCFAASAAIVSSPARFLPPDLTIRIWPINLSQFHSNSIRILGRFLTIRRHNIPKAVGRKMTSCCISGGRCMSHSGLHKPRPQKAGEKPGPRLWQMQCLWIASQTMYPNHHMTFPMILVAAKTWKKLPVLGVKGRSFTANGQAGLKRRHPTEAAMAPQNCQGSRLIYPVQVKFNWIYGFYQLNL